MFQEWKQSAELQAKERHKKVRNTAHNTPHSFADNLKEPAAAFNVRDSKDLSLQQIEITIFTTVVLNIGNIYDESTGIFTLPVNGIFIFSVQVATNGSQWDQFQLVVLICSNILSKAAITLFSYRTITFCGPPNISLIQ